MNEPHIDSSPGTEQFDRVRRRVGFVLAPVLFLVLLNIDLRGLEVPAQRLLAVLAAVVTLWITEAIPLPVTALLGPVLCVLTGAFVPEAGTPPVRQVFRSFADPVIFLFLGSFLLAEAMLHHGLNRRIAFQILGLPGVGASPAKLLAAFGIITGAISMWVSNTATTAMMFPIAMALLREMARRQSESTGRPVDPGANKFATGLMLVTAFAASVGGIGTPVGTPPNLIGIGLIEHNLGVKISFFRWMMFGVPAAVALISFLVVYLNRACPAEPGLLQGSAGWLRTERSGLGGIRVGEWNVMAAFAVTVALWLLPGALGLVLGAEHGVAAWFYRHLPESIAALVGALLLFVLPVSLRRMEFTLGWREAVRIDWGTILLFGGGLALGNLMFSTGLARWIGEGLAGALHAKSLFGLVALFTAVAILLSETTSNTAAATMVVPVAIAVSKAASVDPLPPALGACLGASMGFMLPVSTPPNAIVYGSGFVPLLKMVRYGLLLDLVGFTVIVPVTTWLVPWLMKLN
ncbi:MAG TPA: DASS family sodium-coupled anion symporter [Verrucomicrobiae bacterium]|nr:DASS family sodium-coupled anion symporter [Verrucomicrobiae bacterium]